MSAVIISAQETNHSRAKRPISNGPQSGFE